MGMIVSNHVTEIGPKARVTYHATVMSGVKIGELTGHGWIDREWHRKMLSLSMWWQEFLPSQFTKVKPIAPEEVKKGFEKQLEMPAWSKKGNHPGARRKSLVGFLW